MPNYCAKHEFDTVGPMTNRLTLYNEASQFNTKEADPMYQPLLKVVQPLTEVSVFPFELPVL
jgi:hypothetical protein